MTNEQILEELKAAMKANNEARVKSNEAICHAINVVERADKEYERGMNDAWEIVKEILDTDYSIVKIIFGEKLIGDIIAEYSPLEVKEKLDAYNKTKLDVGDIVKDTRNERRAIILDKNFGGMWEVFNENGYVDRWYEGCFVKTGEHANLFEALKLKRG